MSRPLNRSPCGRDVSAAVQMPLFCGRSHPDKQPIAVESPLHAHIHVPLRPSSTDTCSHSRLIFLTMMMLGAVALAGCEGDSIGQLSVKGEFDPASLEFGD